MGRTSGGSSTAQQRDGTGRKRRRIAYVSSRFPVLREAFIIREVLALQRAGVDVRVFSLKKPHHHLTNRDLDEISGKAYWTPNLLSWALVRDNLSTCLRTPLTYCATPLRHAFAFRRHPVQALKTVALFPKMVHYSREIQRQGLSGINACWASLPALLAKIARQFFDVPFCMTCRAWDIFVPMNQADLPDKVKAATIVRANNDAGARFMKQFCTDASDERKIRRVYNPVDVTAIQPRASIPTGPMKIVSGGSLIDQKGLPYLLDAVSLLQQQGLTCHVEIIGEGPLRAELEAQCARLGLGESVQFPGTVPNHEFMERMSLAHAFVLPSVPAPSGQMDGIPNVLIESMSLGVPVVSTSISGIPELVEDGVTGLLVPPHDAGSLAGAIRRLAGDFELQRRFSLEGRARVEALFEMSRNARELIRIYESGGLL